MVLLGDSQDLSIYIVEAISQKTIKRDLQSQKKIINFGNYLDIKKLINIKM